MAMDGKVFRNLVPANTDHALHIQHFDSIATNAHTIAQQAIEVG